LPLAFSLADPIRKGLGGFAKDAAGGAVGAVADAVTEAVGKAVASLSTLWVSVGTPNLTLEGGGPSESVAFIQNSLWWYMAAAAVFAVIVGGAKTAWEGRQEPLRAGQGAVDAGGGVWGGVDGDRVGDQRGG